MSDVAQDDPGHAEPFGKAIDFIQIEPSFAVSESPCEQVGIRDLLLLGTDRRREFRGHQRAGDAVDREVLNLERNDEDVEAPFRKQICVENLLVGSPRGRRPRVVSRQLHQIWTRSGTFLLRLAGLAFQVFLILIPRRLGGLGSGGIPRQVNELGNEQACRE
ncbi:MAG TPA: hypothetical protein VEN78_25925 [Bradyrhizobium sp.]|nr:hypothetical protein [Bradyrhizobium sp.]